MHAVSSNQIADILHFNDEIRYRMILLKVLVFTDTAKKDKIKNRITSLS